MTGERDVITTDANANNDDTSNPDSLPPSSPTTSYEKRELATIKQARKTILILGAGYAGLFLSLNLETYLARRSDCNIVLVDKNPYHQLLQEIHFVAAGARTPQQVQISIPAMLKDKKIQFIQAKVKQILLNERKVLLAPPDDASITAISYDYLVVALGASTRYFDIAGAEQCTLPLRSISDAGVINVKVQELLQSTDDKGKEDKESIRNDNANLHYKKIVIVGGGATGVSLASALSDYVRNYRKLHPSATDPSNVSIEIIEATPTILPGWDKKLVRECMKVLWEKSVKVFTSVPVAKVEQNKLYLKDGTIIPSSLTVWTAGVKGFDVKTEPEIPKLHDGRIVINEFCQCEKYPDVFALGDIAALKKESTDKIFPPLAQVAVREAKYLAEVLAGYIVKGKTGNEKFDYSIKAQVISMGVNDYVGSFGDYVITGDVAKIVEEFSKDAYLKTLKSGGEDMASNLYGSDTISQVLAGITFAGFTFNRILHRL
jgi:NADH dehydrogenase